MPKQILLNTNWLDYFLALNNLTPEFWTESGNPTVDGLKAYLSGTMNFEEMEIVVQWSAESESNRQELANVQLHN